MPCPNTATEDTAQADENGCSVIMADMAVYSFCTYVTLYHAFMIASGQNRGTAAEGDAIGEQQLKGMQSASSG